MYVTILKRSFVDDHSKSCLYFRLYIGDLRWSGISCNVFCRWLLLSVYVSVSWASWVRMGRCGSSWRSLRLASAGCQGDLGVTVSRMFMIGDEHTSSVRRSTIGTCTCCTCWMFMSSGKLRLEFYVVLFRLFERSVFTSRALWRLVRLVLDEL